MEEDLCRERIWETACGFWLIADMNAPPNCEKRLKHLIALRLDFMPKSKP